jgi:hypothetical protein
LPGSHFNVDGNSAIPRGQNAAIRTIATWTVYRQAGHEIALWFRAPMPWRPRWSRYSCCQRRIAAIDVTTSGGAAETRSRLDEPALCCAYKLRSKSDSHPYAAILIWILRGWNTARNHSDDKQNHARYGGSTAHGFLRCVGCWRVKHRAARAHGLNLSTGLRVCGAEVGRAARRISLSRRTEVERYARNRIAAACDLIPQI